MRVVVTRPPDHGEPLVQRLEQQGHEVIVCPLIELEPVGPDQVDLSGYDWLVVTSANAARELGHRATGKAARVAAIGPGTAAALSEPPDLVPAVSTQEGLLAELPRPAGKVLFAGAEGARKLLIEELDADFVPLYRTKELVPDEFPEADLVVLASPSAARAFAATGRRLPAVSIGPETTAAAERAGVEILREARTHDLEGLVNAVTG